MKTLLLLSLVLGSVSGFAVPLHRVSGAGHGYDDDSRVEVSAIEDMYGNAKAVCASVGSVAPKRVSGISIVTRPVFGTYGRVHVTASALFHCE